MPSTVVRMSIRLGDWVNRLLPFRRPWVSVAPEVEDLLQAARKSRNRFILLQADGNRFVQARVSPNSGRVHVECVGRENTLAVMTDEDEAALLAMGYQPPSTLPCGDTNYAAHVAGIEEAAEMIRGTMTNILRVGPSERIVNTIHTGIFWGWLCVDDEGSTPLQAEGA